ncbi:17744_t:CDS:10, partial [Racocetra fulgida]
TPRTRSFNIPQSKINQTIEILSHQKSSPGWLVGSAKKELERTKALLESTSGELTKEIEKNESLHKELFEAKSLYTQHSNVLESKILELERKAEELQNELTRSHLASEDAMSTLRQEKRELDNELEQTRSELLLIDNESNELIASFKQLQLNAKDYLKALEEKSESSYDLGLRVKNASKVWQQNLQTLAVKLASSQNLIKLKNNCEISYKTNNSLLISKLASQDDDEEEFVYPVNPEKQEIPESSSQSIENTSQLSTIMTTQTISARSDIGMKTLIKKHYESKISQLTNQLNSADQKSVQLHNSLKVIKEKLVESENLKLRSEQENVKLQNELSRLKEKLNEDRANYDTQLKEMRGWAEQRQNKDKELDDELSGYKAGTSRNE